MYSTEIAKCLYFIQYFFVWIRHPFILKIYMPERIFEHVIEVYSSES